MKEVIINKFNGGLNTDLAFTDVQPDMLIDALNARITAEGDGFVVSNLKGMKKKFELTFGFRLLGSADYNGVLYLISWNDTTKETEIGTYPSPKMSEEGYEDVYRPLMSFTYDNPNLFVNGCYPEYNMYNVAPFRTTALEHDLDHPVRVKIKEEFDGSVNIYWNDTLRPIRVVNSGFKQSGINNGRVTSQASLLGGHANLINESNFHPCVDFANVVQGGNLSIGTYYFFIRYIDLNYNATSFLGHSNAIPVFFNRSFNITYGGESIENTDKKVVLDISELDPSMPFIELAYFRFFDGSFEAKLIDYRFSTGGGTSLQIEITGNESTLALQADDITTFKPSDALIANDIEQLNNVLYLFGTKGQKLDHEDLRRFGCAIEAHEQQETLGPDLGATGVENYYSTSSNDTHNKLGYFSSETYCFCFIPVFKGGFVGQPIPVKGYDNITGSEVDPNVSGAYRFSHADVAPFWNGSTLYTKAIRFDMAAATAVFAGSQWLNDNLIGGYFGRAELKENRIGQFLLVRGMSGEGWRSSGASWDETNIEELAQFPFFIPYCPSYYVDNEPLIPAEAGFAYSKAILNTNNIKDLCAFSLDYYTFKRDAPKTVHVRKHWHSPYPDRSTGYQNAYWNKIIDNTNNALNKAGQAVKIAGWQQTGLILDPKEFSSEAVNVIGWTVPTNDTFTSKRSEGKAVGNDSLFYHYNDIAATTADELFLNLPLATMDYIGLKDSPPWKFGTTAPTEYTGDDFWCSLATIYRTRPEGIDYKTVYDFKNTSFSVISRFYNISDLLAQNHVIYQGDCFVGMQWLKLMHGHEAEIGTELIDDIAEFNLQDTFKKGYGHFVGFYSESKANPSYRDERGRNKFYPATDVLEPGKQFSWLFDSPESNFYNQGYSVTESPRKLVGIDKLAPISDNYFPTRIRPSLSHIIGAVRDGYRQFIPADAKDFDLQHGAMIAGIAHADAIYSIQQFAINLHPINERAMTQTDAGDRAAFAEQTKLTQYKRTIATNFGTGHRFSVIKGENGIYGFDYQRQCIWTIKGDGVANLSLSKGVDKMIRSFFANKTSNITTFVPDSHTNGWGIHGHYDSNHKEVVFTLLLIIDEKPFHETICFAEKRDLFTSRYSFKPKAYASIRDEFYSVDDDGMVFLHDALEDRLLFYGKQQDWMIRFVVNNTPEVLKHYDNLTLNSNNVTFSYIKYETQHQKAEQVPFIKEKWYLPVYNLNQWNFPIRRASMLQQPSLNRFGVESPLRGKWLAIELGYTGTERVVLRESLTFIHKEPKH